MRAIALVLVMVALSACSRATIDASTRTSTGAVAPVAGTTVVSGRGGVHIESRALAAVVIAGMFMAAAIEDARDPRPFPSFSVLSDWFRGTPRPQLAHDRVVVEHDCTQPIPEDFTGNLKCR
jgi:hypothetical protein